MLVLTEKDKTELMAYITELPFKHANPLVRWFAMKEQAQAVKDAPVVPAMNGEGNEDGK